MSNPPNPRGSTDARAPTKLRAGEILLSAAVPLYGMIAAARAVYNQDQNRMPLLPLISIGNLLVLQHIG